MCGGVRFKYDERLEPALSEIYTSEQLGRARAQGFVESLFWQARPVLPVLFDNHLRIYDWGNHDDTIKLPKTGWMRVESLDAGKWNYLRPRAITIPVFQGVEKRVWFGIDYGIRGFLVKRDGAERVYMLTLPSTPEYQALTGHDRMPALIDQDTVVPLEQGGRQAALGQ